MDVTFRFSISFIFVYCFMSALLFTRVTSQDGKGSTTSTHVTSIKPTKTVTTAKSTTHVTITPTKVDTTVKPTQLQPSFKPTKTEETVTATKTIAAATSKEHAVTKPSTTDAAVKATAETSSKTKTTGTSVNVGPATKPKPETDSTKPSKPGDVVKVRIADAAVIPPAKVTVNSAIPIQEAPYQVSILISRKYACSGVIINELFILTAAECVDGVPEADVTVRIGSKYVDRDGEIIQVTKITKHPMYTAASPDNNIAVLELLNRIEFKDYVAVVGFSSTEWPMGTEGLATGWKPIDGETPVPVLKRTTMKIVPHKACEPKKYNQKNMICVGSLQPMLETCLWRSGSPLVVHNIVVGIFNFKLGCEPGNSRVYTSVPAFRKFIRGVVLE
ncbi:trypsin-7 [Tribolium castaneum]|uniref:trypsin-7 n=1 Tax=Tribolium castaneum TaxID=7070 RepID=UPI0030FE3EA2